MIEPFDLTARRAIRSALARDAYRTGRVQVADPDIVGYTWLVASHRGLFAVSDDRQKTVIHGWFFGIEKVGDLVYLYENCGLRDRSTTMGRIVRYRIVEGRLDEPTILVTGLHNNCHQIRMIDGALCLVDTANQAIRRYTPQGELIDVRTPFPVAPPSDESGAYLHINSIARIGDRIAILRHNGKAVPDKPSELAWLDNDWTVLAIEPLAGHLCHDIVRDEHGVVWHSASAEGEIISSTGRKIRITDRLMTRALGFTADRVIVGITTFGPRQLRDTFAGSVSILDRDFRPLAQLVLPGSPTDLVAI